MTEYFEIGKIVNTQGVKGEVRIIPSTFDIKRFDLLDMVEIRSLNHNATKTMAIEKVRYHKQFVIIKFKGIDTMNDGEDLKGYRLVVPREKAIPLEDDEYYTADLYGMEVITSNGEVIGHVSEIIETGANDVYVVSAKGKKDILLPAIKKCILDVNINEKKMLVETTWMFMEGLL